jgi:hypothetical protein
MKRFEYLDKRGPMASELNGLGNQGWELVAISDGRYVFKREIAPSPEYFSDHERTKNGNNDGYGR